MTGGMAGIAGTVLVLYATVLNAVIPDVAAHLLVASVLGAPAAILISLIMVPETSSMRERIPCLILPDWRRTRWTRSPRGLRQASNCCSILRDAGRTRRPGASRQCDPGAPAGCSRQARFSLQRILGIVDGAGLLAHGHPMGSGRYRRRPDGHQDNPQ